MRKSRGIEGDRKRRRGGERWRKTRGESSERRPRRQRINSSTVLSEPLRPLDRFFPRDVTIRSPMAERTATILLFAAR